MSTAEILARIADRLEASGEFHSGFFLNLCMDELGGPDAFGARWKALALEMQRRTSSMFIDHWLNRPERTLGDVLAMLRGEPQS